MDAPEKSTLIRVSAVCYSKPVGKKYRYNGSLQKELLPRPLYGEAVNLEFEDFEDYAKYRLTLDARHVLFSGSFDDTVVTGARVSHQHNPEADVHVTNDFLAHRQHASVCRIDVDFKREEEVYALYPPTNTLPTYEDVDVVLREIVPYLRNIALFITDSSSSLIYDLEGNQLTPPGGLRIEFGVSDASLIPSILQDIHYRCWANGYGWAFVSKGGAFLPRSLVDLALARPHQPEFVCPTLVDCVSRRRARYVPGESLLLDFQPLSNADTQAAVDLIKRVKRVLTPQLERVQAEVEARVLERFRDPKKARKFARLYRTGVMAGRATVRFVNGAEPTCNELALDGERFDGLQCYDPIEPDYQYGAVGMFFWNEGQRPGVFSFAHGLNRWYHVRCDRAAVEDVIASTEDQDEIARAFAVSVIDSLEHTELFRLAANTLRLGRNTRALKDAIEYQRVDRAEPFSEELEEEAKQRPLPAIAFPYVRDQVLISHEDNLKALLAGYGITMRYNVINKRVEARYRGCDTESDKHEEQTLAHILSLASLNGLPKGDVGVFLPALSSKYEFNPVTDYLKQLKWDGVSRLRAFNDIVCQTPTDLTYRMFRYWFIQACAAADNAVIARGLIEDAQPAFEYLLLLISGQGKKKTKGLRALLPRPLRIYFKDGVNLNTHDKDSVKLAVSGWVVELGEIQSTFKKSDIDAIKGFSSKQEDELRLPYAQAYSRFKRRTVYVGTANSPNLLADKTGNRRYFPVDVKTFWTGWDDSEIDQLWAEAWALYVVGNKWWPSYEEELAFVKHVEDYETDDVFYEALLEKYDWESTELTPRRVPPVTIMRFLRGDKYNPVPRDYSELRSAVLKIWKQNGALERKGVLTIRIGREIHEVWVAKGGNRGFILPPQRLFGA